MTYAEGIFWGLGFDPLPGDPQAVKALESDAREFGRRMIDQADFLRRVANRDGWQGEAADAFASHVGSIPKDFDKIGSAFLNLAGAMAKYHDRFVQEKAKARQLEERAVAARQKLNSAQFVSDAPVISTRDSCPVASDQRPVTTAEDELGDLLREGHAFAERFDCGPEVQGLAKAIREFATNAPDEPRWNIIRHWAGEVFSTTPVGAALNAAHGWINRFPEFFSDLSQLLSDLSGFLGVLSLPLMFLPPIGTVLAVSALALTAGSAAVKTSLYAGHARDANGNLYVNGGTLMKSYVDVGLGAVGIGVAAGAARAVDTARVAKASKAVAAAERAGRAVSPGVAKAARGEVSFGKSLAERLSGDNFRKSVTAPGKFLRTADRLGGKATAKIYWRQAARQYTAADAGRRYNIAGLVLSGVSPLPTSGTTNVGGWQAPVHLFRDDITTILSNAPDAPDLQIKAQPVIGGPRSDPPHSIRPVKPTIGPVMDR